MCYIKKITILINLIIGIKYFVLSLFRIVPIFCEQVNHEILKEIQLHESVLVTIKFDLRIEWSFRFKRFYNKFFRL